MPNQDKMDKASFLMAAIEYIKQLQVAHPAIAQYSAQNGLSSCDGVWKQLCCPACISRHLQRKGWLTGVVVHTRRR